MSLKRTTPTKNTRTPSLIIIGAVLLVIIISGWWMWDTQYSTRLNGDGTIRNCESISRESYGISPAVFELLPKPPACFYTIINAYRTGTFANPFFFDEKYYSQPEFFPAFQHEKFQAWKEPTPGFWGAVGYGAYPSEFNLTLLPGETTRVRFFMFAGTGVRTHQGMRIDTLFSNPLDANHITVKILSDATDGFILGPSFPKFDSKWAHPVDVEITAAKNIPPETLHVNFRVKSPSTKTADAGAEKYGTNYYPATAYVGERTPATMSVTILPETPAPVFSEAIK